MDQIASIAQHLLQFSPDALIVVDDRGIMLFANATTRALFGYSREQMIGQPIDMLVPERYRLRHGAHISGYVRNPSNREMGARLIDLFARRADGSEFPAGIRLAPFHDGERAFVAAAIRDMTERRAINDALIAAREDADRANLAKSRFLATASHDLRQPLQTIRLLNASLLTMTLLNPDVNDLLRRQESAIDSATRLLNSVLDITRLESGAIEPNLTPVALSAIFADLQTEFEALAKHKSLNLIFQASSAVISTDRMLLAQLLQNVVGNALKYTASGVVKVTERSECDALVLIVEDTGMGIPGDKLERIFDEYYQVDPSGTQRSGVGLGIRLWSPRSLAAARASVFAFRCSESPARPPPRVSEAPSSLDPKCRFALDWCCWRITIRFARPPNCFSASRVMRRNRPAVSPRPSPYWRRCSRVMY
jgi:PAS domain S-box-containing protein